MRPLHSFVGQPIRSLQTMLRVIAEDDPTHLRIVPDGIYGPETTAAISTFQRKHGLPVTGVTDQATWEAVVGVYSPALVRIDAAQPVDIIMNPGQVIRRGESSAGTWYADLYLTGTSCTASDTASGRYHYSEDCFYPETGFGKAFAYQGKDFDERSYQGICQRCTGWRFCRYY